MAEQKNVWKPSNKNVPKTVYKKNGFSDYLSMAQGGMNMPMIPKNIKIFVVIGVFFLIFGVVSLIVDITKALIAYPLYTSISLAVLGGVGYLVYKLKFKKKVN